MMLRFTKHTHRHTLSLSLFFPSSSLSLLGIAGRQAAGSHSSSTYNTHCLFPLFPYVGKLESSSYAYAAHTHTHGIHPCPPWVFVLLWYSMFFFSVSTHQHACRGAGVGEPNAQHHFHRGPAPLHSPLERSAELLPPRSLVVFFFLSFARYGFAGSWS